MFTGCPGLSYAGQRVLSGDAIGAADGGAGLLGSYLLTRCEKPKGRF
ncbi:MAG: hypothetical protein QME75_01330 [Deltaproteobacteria bacterium]|nr:hypothetical protein [Deltaproteobacteria bacterium]